MKKIIPYLYLLACVLVFSIKVAAAPASTPGTAPADNSLPAILAKWYDGNKKKLTFIERIIYKKMVKKLKKAATKVDDPPVDADKLAKQAHTFGWLSLLVFFVFPLASIPLAILAITKGTKALENNTTLAQRAKTGRIVGIVTLGFILLAIGLIVMIVAEFSLA